MISDIFDALTSGIVLGAGLVFCILAFWTYFYFQKESKRLQKVELLVIKIEEIYRRDSMMTFRAHYRILDGLNEGEECPAAVSGSKVHHKINERVSGFYDPETKLAMVEQDLKFQKLIPPLLFAVGVIIILLHFFVL